MFIIKKKKKNENLPPVLERLYTKDLEKRRQNKEILTKIYTPTFTPFLYYKDGLKKRVKKDYKTQVNTDRSKNSNSNIRKYNTVDEDNSEDDENNSEDNDEKYYSEKKRKVKLIKIKKGISKSKGKKSKKSKNKKNESSSENDENKSENEGEEIIHHDRAEIENVMRNRLFKRSKSAVKRKNKSVTFE